MEFRVLELFSGIGGMHYAFKYAQLPGEVVTAMDINTVANAVYAHNHTAETPVQNANIQRLTSKTLEKLRINTLFMSPPCQPHTRVGHQRDIADNRSDALQHICSLLPQCSGLSYVLMENVRGFERSQARDNFIEALSASGFYWREFILSPTQFGVPNTRHRYYCLARKNTDFPFMATGILEEMPSNYKSFSSATAGIRQLLEAEESISADAYLPEKVLSRRVWLLDIVTADATNTMCFTKAYTHYAEGTGSIYTPLAVEEMTNIFSQVKALDEQVPTDDADAEMVKQRRLKLLQQLRLRYFTPREVARLMSFPECFDFPTETTNRQKYRLLGNSINVCVVGELVKLLTTTDA